jgi:hypothetical protein
MRPRPTVVAAIVAALTLAVLALACTKEAARPPRRMVVLFVDVTRSLVEAERNVVAEQSSAILASLKPGTEFRVYPIQIETAVVAPIESGTVLIADNDLDQRPRHQIRMAQEKVQSSIIQLYGVSAAGTDNQSCILNSLQTAGEDFRRFRAAHEGRPLELDLIFVSDMIEECDHTPVGRIELDKRDIAADIRRIQGMPCDSDLSDVRISVVVPATVGLDSNVKRELRPDRKDRREFWTEVFKACRYPENRFADAHWFSFSAGVPSRFSPRDKKASR